MAIEEPKTTENEKHITVKDLDRLVSYENNLNACKTSHHYLSLTSDIYYYKVLFKTIKVIRYSDAKFIVLSVFLESKRFMDIKAHSGI